MTTEVSASANADECQQHHWMLPSPGGPTSLGTCKHCGAEREFSNATGKTWVPRTAPRR